MKLYKNKRQRMDIFGLYFPIYIKYACSGFGFFPKTNYYNWVYDCEIENIIRNEIWKK